MIIKKEIQNLETYNESEFIMHSLGLDETDRKVVSKGKN